MILAITVVVAAAAVAVAVVAAIRIRRYPIAPSKRRWDTEPNALLILGVVFLGLGVVYAIIGEATFYPWLPVGIVFLGVGARRRRKASQTSLRR